MFFVSLACRYGYGPCSEGNPPPVGRSVQWTVRAVSLRDSADKGQLRLRSVPKGHCFTFSSSGMATGQPTMEILRQSGDRSSGPVAPHPIGIERIRGQLRLRSVPKGHCLSLSFGESAKARVEGSMCCMRSRRNPLFAEADRWSAQLWLLVDILSCSSLPKCKSE